MSSFFSSKAKATSLLLKDSSHYCLFYRRIESYGCRGGIRTHDQRPMKTLSYHCSTLRYMGNFADCYGLPSTGTIVTGDSTGMVYLSPLRQIADFGSRTQCFLDMNQACKPFHSAAIYTRQRFRTFSPQINAFYYLLCLPLFILHIYYNKNFLFFQVRFSYLVTKLLKKNCGGGIRTLN